VLLKSPEPLTYIWAIFLWLHFLAFSRAFPPPLSIPLWSIWITPSYVIPWFPNTVWYPPPAVCVDIFCERPEGPVWVWLTMRE
jgi:hypothetical protein